MKKIALSALISIAKAKLWLDAKIEKLEGLAQLKTVKNRGVSCRFEGRGTIIDPTELKLGNHSSLGRNFFIRATGGVEVGDHTHISRNVTIHTSNHNINGNLLPYSKEVISAKIKIGSYVWIGMNSSILGGVTIGDGAVIGMNTVVTKDVPPGDIVVGSQQRTVGRRDETHTKSLVASASYLKINDSWDI